MSTNILLLTADALRADYLPWHGADESLAPNLAGLAETATTFREAYSVSSHTREAVPGLLTGQYPDTCVNDSYALRSPTVPEFLPDSYVSAAFHSNPYVSRAYGYGDCFDQFDDDLYIGKSRIFALGKRLFDKLRNRHYASAEQISRRILNWIQTTEEPFFVWGHYMDTHGPYHPPSHHRSRNGVTTTSSRRSQRLYKRAVSNMPFESGEREELIEMYKGEIRYMDAQIGWLLDKLRDSGCLNDTTVFFSADHGDGFDENGYYGHPRRLDDELLHVPLMVKGKHFNESPISTQVSLLDILPTIVEHIVPESQAGDFSGESLARIASSPGQFEDRFVFLQVRGQDDESHVRRYRLHSDTDSARIEQDIPSGEIITEPTDCSDATARLLRSHAKQRWQQHHNVESPESEQTVSDTVSDRLEALGYREN